MAHRFIAARGEAADAKAAKDRDRQKAAGAEIRKLKGEMASLGLSDAAALLLVNGKPPVKESAPIPESPSESERAGVDGGNDGNEGILENSDYRSRIGGNSSSDGDADGGEVGGRSMLGALNPEMDPAYWGGISANPTSSDKTGQTRHREQNLPIDPAMDPDYWDVPSPARVRDNRNTRTGANQVLESKGTGNQAADGLLSRSGSDSEEVGMGLFDEDAIGGGWESPPPPVKRPAVAIRPTGRLIKGTISPPCKCFKTFLDEGKVYSDLFLL